MSFLARAGRELADRGSPLFGPFSQVDRWDRSRFGHARVALDRLLEPWEPAWGRHRTAVSASEPLALIGIYRRANAAMVEQLAADGPATVGLWALDEVAPSLAHWTVGTGPGLRFSLLNRVLDALELNREWWVVVADDDVRFLRGGLPDSLSVARSARLDLAQPSHARWSYLNWEVTRHRPGRLARLCRYVEQGPLMILSPAGRAALTPFPEDLGMGWGVEARWGAETGLRTGIIDAVTMIHERPVGQGGYDAMEQWDQAEALLGQHGWTSWQALQATQATWWAWQPRPPWLQGQRPAVRGLPG